MNPRPGRYSLTSTDDRFWLRLVIDYVFEVKANFDNTDESTRLGFDADGGTLSHGRLLFAKLRKMSKTASLLAVMLTA
jgi:hypothetical protein